MTIPDRLIECPIEEATCVVNARGEEIEIMRRPGLIDVFVGSHGFGTTFDAGAIKRLCLTPCKPKPVFVEAVSVHGIHKMLECYQGHRKVVELQHSGCSVYFKTTDLAGIENISPEQLEIVLRVKKVSE